MDSLHERIRMLTGLRVCCQSLRDVHATSILIHKLVSHRSECTSTNEDREHESLDFASAYVELIDRGIELLQNDSSFSSEYTASSFAFLVTSIRTVLKCLPSHAPNYLWRRMCKFHVS